MKKMLVPLVLVPLFLVGCGKNKDVYAKSSTTIYSFELSGNNAIITGFGENYKNQSSIIIPYSIDKHVVTKISDNAFYDQYRIKNVDMSKSKIVEIGEKAFNKCDGLEKITFAKTAEKIGNGAFSECTSMQEIDMSNTTVTTISDEMFKKCSSLTNIVFPKDAKVLGSNVFASCDNLKTLDFTDTKFETFENEALANLKNLSKITFPTTLKEVKDNCFYSDKKIQFVDLSKTSLEKIGNKAFGECEIMENINIPATLKEIGKESFMGCSKLKKIDLSKTQVAEIPESAFELCVALSTVNLSNVTSISKRAFYNSGLTKISLPATLTSIADDSFRLCNSLKSFSVASSNTSYAVRKDALYTADLKKLIQYPAAKEDTLFECYQEVEQINQYAFAYATKLETVDLLPALYLDTIDDYTFFNCEKLSTIKIEDHLIYSIKKIGVKAFCGCNSLTAFNGLSSVQEIGDSAFYECGNLQTVLLKNAPIKTIGNQAFFRCGNLKTITFNSSLESIGKQAFYGCGSLETIKYSGSRSSLDIILEESPNCGLEDYYSIIECNA